MKKNKNMSVTVCVKGLFLTGCIINAFERVIKNFTVKLISLSCLFLPPNPHCFPPLSKQILSFKLKSSPRTTLISCSPKILLGMTVSISGKIPVP